MTKLAEALQKHDAELDNILDELRDRIKENPKDIDIMVHARLMFTYNVLNAQVVGFDILESGLVKSAITQMIDVCATVDLHSIFTSQGQDPLIERIGNLMDDLAEAYNDTIDELEASK